MAEVRLDENGEPLSKNALKKLLKKEAADKKKAEKAAARVRHDNMMNVMSLMYHVFREQDVDVVHMNIYSNHTTLSTNSLLLT